MRTKDRLAELRHLANGAAVGVYHETVQPTAHDDAELAAILHEVQAARGPLARLRELTAQLRRLQAQPTFHADAGLQAQLQGAVREAAAQAQAAAAALRGLDARAAAARGRRDAAARIVRVQLAGARAHFAAALRDHGAALDALRDARLHLLRRQLRLTNLSLSEEECERLVQGAGAGVDEGEGAALFVDNVRAESAEARRVLREAEARHGELARVEAALREVRELFAQLALLVAAQQDQLDSVEHYALQATDHVGQGGGLLLRGTVTRARARKKKLALIMCLAAGAAIVVLVLVVT